MSKIPNEQKRTDFVVVLLNSRIHMTPEQKLWFEERPKSDWLDRQIRRQKFRIPIIIKNKFHIKYLSWKRRLKNFFSKIS